MGYKLSHWKIEGTVSMDPTPVFLDYIQDNDLLHFIHVYSSKRTIETGQLSLEFMHPYQGEEPDY